MIVYLDFDGTVVEHEYPKMGRCNYGCFEVIKKLQDSGHSIILNTYRADINDGTLQKALDYINHSSAFLVKDRTQRGNLKLEEINMFLPEKEYPHRWNIEGMKHTNKIFIDDLAKNIPLKKCVMARGNMVDWDEVEKQLTEAGIIMV